MKLLIQSILLTIIFTVLTGVLYPLAITGIAQVAFRDQANGSLIIQKDKAVGSSLLAQQFTGEKYFWPRPSAGSYGTTPSGASNLGPTSGTLQSNVATNAAAFRAAHKLAADAPVPTDMVFTSGSGLDPHISPESAQAQLGRVAAARTMSTETIRGLVEKHIEQPQFGFLGEPRVNVLRLNLALDQMDGGKTGAVNP